mmetsp:Transcript_7721/g.19122  ORF Transcript_7721/g.19122 Transcript_7721/m.19122 type:complete len:125 (+) Transcript_7721:228-602(+)
MCVKLAQLGSDGGGGGAAITSPSTVAPAHEPYTSLKQRTLNSSPTVTDLTILSASPALASDTTACSAALHGVTFERNDMNGPAATAVRLVLFESKAATSLGMRAGRAPKTAGHSATTHPSFTPF